MMDLSKLRPAPWHVERFRRSVGKEFFHYYDLTYGPADDPAERFSVLDDSNLESEEAALRFAALARNAFDIQMRRGWGVENVDDGWRVNKWDADAEGSRFYLWVLKQSEPNPLIALVEAEKWYAANVEKTP